MSDLLIYGTFASVAYLTYLFYDKTFRSVETPTLPKRFYWADSTYLNLPAYGTKYKVTDTETESLKHLEINGALYEIPTNLLDELKYHLG